MKIGWSLTIGAFAGAAVYSGMHGSVLGSVSWGAGAVALAGVQVIRYRRSRRPQ